ncbi:MAG TPA: hypothetical protein VFV94_15680, partial [Polyangiaceae bacterium]|nr:hypothetical protein [Polyangiaceae bacterium]
AWGLVALSAACGHSAGSTGSNTNWLTRCDDDGDCGVQGVCWCGACTTPCGDGKACRDGTCRASDELGCGTPSGANVCAAECTTTADCPRNGEGFVCVNGACLPEASAGGGGGSGAAAGASSGGQGSGGQMSGGGGAGGSGAGASGAANGGSAAGGAPIGGELVPDGERLGVSGGHTCYLWNDGFESHVDCWGSNIFGQASALLPGIVDETVDAPRRVVNLTDPVAVAVNEEHSCALTAAGDVYCWGFNDGGQVGSPSAPAGTCPSRKPEEAGDSYECQPEPQRVEGIANAVRIGVARGRSCALLADGTVRCWGNVDQALADWLSGVADARSLAVGASGVCVTNASGDASCSFTLTTASSVGPLEAMALTRDSPVPGGFGCTLGTDRLVRCFGDDSVGQLGTGMALQEHGLSNATSDASAIAVGVTHACALGNDAKVGCWGRNTSGAVGTPPRTSPVCGADYCEARPLEVAGLPPIAAIGAGSERTCAAATDRTLWCWGPGSGPAGESVTLERIGGPWEPGPLECEERVGALTSARRDMLQAAVRGCDRDQDCVNVSVDLSCSHTCAYESVYAGAVADLGDAIAALERGSCAGLAGCSMPGASCAPPTTRPVCIFGTCSQEDPDHSGCDDACGCAASVWAKAQGDWRDECTGFDLWPVTGGACGECRASTSAIIVGNRGSARFTGQATLSFEPQEGADGSLVLPAPELVTLDLEPGALSAPIHVRSTAQTILTIRITAPGDCNPQNDASAETEFVSPFDDCN